ncbi:hypothetical protein WJX72_008864 [[Myrmecia] bisecta]|uniref:Leucine-rich repeat-containing N-terminal plant-type domain-containing protein n=1 Tax=[Myrmecia] bisecta TaxID=41462 RepID=A0AAW1PX92_9CHLO
MDPRGVLVFVVATSLLVTASAFTLPSEVALLQALKANLTARGPNWAGALNKKWTCPSNTGDGDCDPCGHMVWWGAWAYLGCRGDTIKQQDILGGDGHVTNIHFTNFHAEGPDLPIDQLCVFPHLKELDITDGTGGTPPISGTVPQEVVTCFPRLNAIKFSFNALTGSLPTFIQDAKELQYIKVRNNQMSGTIPPEVAVSPIMYFLDLQGNQFNGSMPATFKDHPVLSELTLAKNDFSGDLYNLAGANLIYVSTADNPGLCGMVPATVKYSHGYNPHNTSLGQPCPGATYPPVIM